MRLSERLLREVWCFVDEYIGELLDMGLAASLRVSIRHLTHYSMKACRVGHCICQGGTLSRGRRLLVFLVFLVWLVWLVVACVQSPAKD